MGREPVEASASCVRMNVRASSPNGTADETSLSAPASLTSQAAGTGAPEGAAPVNATSVSVALRVVATNSPPRGRPGGAEGLSATRLPALSARAPPGITTV